MYVEEEILIYQFCYQVQINQLYITSPSKSMSGLVTKIFQCSIIDTVLIMMRFCMITEGLDFSLEDFQRQVHNRVEPQMWLVKTAIQSSLRDRQLFQNMFSGSLKNIFQKTFFSGDSHSQTTLSPHIQWWLKVCQLIPGQHFPAQLFQARYNIQSGEEELWISLSKSMFLGHFYENIASLNHICQ